MNPSSFHRPLLKPLSSFVCFAIACSQAPSRPQDGGSSPAQPPYDVVLRASAVPACGDWAPPPRSALGAQTPRGLHVGVTSVELLRSRGDAHPVAFLTADPPVDLDLSSTATLATKSSGELAQGVFTHVRLSLASAAWSVGGTAHAPGFGAVPGDVRFDVALGDGRDSTGRSRRQGDYVATFSAFGSSQALPGTLPLNCPLSRTGGAVATSGGKFEITLKLPGGPLDSRARHDKAREIALAFPVTDVFRWRDVPGAGYSPGVFDLAATPQEGDATQSLGVCDLFMADRCEGDWQTWTSHEEPAWPMPDSPTVLCSDGRASATACPSPGGAAYGQDGNHRERVPSYEVNGDTVTDSQTGLVWQRGVAPGQSDWWDARDYCAALELGGSSDWRLPSRIELVSLLDAGRIDPSIDLEAFPGTPSDFFWSSSPLPFSGLAFGVRFEQGFTYDHDPNGSGRVRCVRGAGAKPATRFTAGDQTVRDAATGLRWQRAMAPASMNWVDALAWCDALSLDGSTDWRLPDLKEAQTIVDEEAAGPAIDLDVFPQTPAEWFWTSSPAANAAGFAWGMSLTDGYTTPNATSSLFRVRCVSGGSSG